MSDWFWERIGLKTYFLWDQAASNPIESPNSAPIWQAFDVYSSVSCNLFLNLHPEIGSLNQKASQLLAKRPQVLVGYCKRPCTHYDTRFDAWQKDLVNSTHPILHHIYARPFDEFWEYETEDNDGSDNSNYINKRLTISEMSQIVINFKDIPLSKEYLPEIISFSALLTLQLIICIQIFRNRRAAKWKPPYDEFKRTTQLFEIFTWHLIACAFIL